MTLKAVLGSVAVVGMLAAACGGSSDDDDADEGLDAAGLGLTCPTDSKVTYEDDIKPFMEKYCTSCHARSLPLADRQGAPSDHNFDTEEGITDEAFHVVMEAAAGPKGENTGMPEGSGPKPTTAERKKLGEWLACNADVDTPDND